jgi:hypothetical protein
MAQRQQLLRAITSRNKDIALRLPLVVATRDCGCAMAATVASSV